MTAAVVLLAVVTAILTLLVVGLLRSQTEILRRLHDLGAGPGDRPTSSAPSPGDQESGPEQKSGRRSADIAGFTPTGDAVSVQVAGVEHDTIVAFLSSNCITCQTFWDAFRTPRKLGLSGGTRLVVVTKGADAESAAAVTRLAPPSIPTVMSTEAFGDYGAPGSPYFVHVHGASGRVGAEGTGSDWGQVSSLLAQPAGGRSAD